MIKKAPYLSSFRALLIFEEEKYLSWQSNIKYIFKASFLPALPLHTFRDRNNNIGISVLDKYSI